MDKAPLLVIEDEDESWTSLYAAYTVLSLLQGVDLPVIGQISLTCTDPYYLRVMMEIISDLTTTGKLRFYELSMEISHTNTDKTVSINFVIPKSGLKCYNRSFNEHSEDYKDAFIPARVNTKRLVKIFKAYVKRDKMSVTAEIRQTGRISQLYCQSCNDDYDMMPCSLEGEGDDNEEITDALAKYYSGRDPETKITVAKLSTAFNKYKTTECGIVRFTLADDHILIAGIREGVQTSATKCWLDGGDTIEYNGPEPQEQSIALGNTNLVVGDYTVSVNYTKCLTWMTKIPRLSYPNSLISIYMREDAPVVLTINIATIGFATFVFRNDPNCK
jgi:hypothetical protein